MTEELAHAGQKALRMLGAQESGARFHASQLYRLSAQYLGRDVDVVERDELVGLAEHRGARRKQGDLFEWPHKRPNKRRPSANQLQLGVMGGRVR